MFEHQIAPDFDLLHDIRHTQAFSENAKQNLSHQAKYNQDFGYAKRVIGISLDMGCEDELNGILQSWIKEKEKEKERQSETLTCNSNKENLPNVSNPYQTRTKGAPMTRIKNVLEENQSQKKSGRYNCSYCKSSGHNARRCELKKNLKNLNLNDYLVILLYQ